ncbi:serine hydrolase [uncultured Psychroserpens sp.]|uniref:serine hydrolase domain-containing protein n=1 Tax=uncultured Psychroserpens sp. TaxID=255436 RepID=UPI00262905FE|nr:serine hydrolase domain-containing protein [uncultured Psychroserpens sp.]
MSYRNYEISNFKMLFTLIYLMFISCSFDVTEHYSNSKEYLVSAENLGFSGIVHIQKNDTVLVNDARGLSNRKERIKNKISTPFYIASISKSFTAAAIIRLEDDKKLFTSDSISKYFKDCPNDKKNITIHQLLTHTSGVNSFGWDNKTNYWSLMTKREAIEGILNNPLRYSLPNNEFNYNNANYILLSAIIEHVAGKSYQEFIKEFLLEPLSLSETHFRYTHKNEIPDLAKSYLGDEDHMKYTDYPKSWLNIGGGDIISTASDMSKWITGLFEKDILSKDGKKKMFSIQKTIEPNFGYGYGWYIRDFPEVGKKIIFHTGGFKGYSSEIRYYPHSKTATVVFVNDDAIPNSTEVISNSLLQIINGKNVVLPKVKNFIVDKEVYVGNYKIDSLSSIKIKSDKKNLIAEYYGQSAMNFIKDYDGDIKKQIKSLNSKSNDFITNLLINPDRAFTEILPEEDIRYLKEYIDEWNLFNESVPISIELNHTIYLKNGLFRTFLTIKHPNENKYFALTWQNGLLIGTLPNSQFDIPKTKLLYLDKNELVSYDWAKNLTEKWLFYEKLNKKNHHLTITKNKKTFLEAKKL